MKTEVTGIMIYYYAICKKKLWYFCNDITMESYNDNVIIGRSIDENFYKNENRHINIDNLINIDFIKSKKIVHEIKKSDSLEYASVLQIKYYIYYLNKKGMIGVKGKLDYPTLKKSVDVLFVDEDKKYIEEIICDIEKIINCDEPPRVLKKSFCKSCAYYDICFI